MTGELPVNIASGDRTLPRLLDLQAARYGDRVLFACNGETWTFTEAAKIAARMAGALHEAGVQAGDRVAILCSNRPEFLRVVLGCSWLGAVAVPINTAVEGPQLRYVLENSAPRLLILEDRHAAVAGALRAGGPAARPYLDHRRYRHTTRFGPSRRSILR